MRPARVLALLLVLAAVLARAPARADGGAVVARAHEAGLLVTVFAAPVPLRAGPADVSVLVQDARDRSAVLDAEVFFELAGTGRWRADHAQATNRLLYAARLPIPSAGAWPLGVEVRADAGRAVSLTAELRAAEALPDVLRFWRWLLLPVLVVAVFLLHQRLREGA